MTDENTDTESENAKFATRFIKAQLLLLAAWYRQDSFAN